MKRLAIAASLLWVSFVATPASALGVDALEIDGSVATASVSAAGGIAAEITVEFESVSNLSASSLGLSVQTVDPTSLTLLARLPSGASVPAAFPLLVRIEPPSAGGLSFVGTVGIEIHTANLEYLPGTTLRLFAAPAGGGFVDITRAMGSGSYRGWGTRGSFSEFLIVADLRSVGDVVEAKLDALEALLTTHASAIPTELQDELAGYVEETRDAVEGNDVAGAIDSIDDLLALLDEVAGGDLPNLWRAARDVANVAGELAAAAETLRFSLYRLPGAPS
jgi:hypothetical protein